MSAWQPLQGGHILLLGTSEFHYRFSSLDNATSGKWPRVWTLRIGEQPCRHRHKRSSRRRDLAQAATLDTLSKVDEDIISSRSVTRLRWLSAEEKIPSHKTCTSCEQNLPASSFKKSFTSRDGLQHWCKDCKQEEDRVKKGKQPILVPEAERTCTHCNTLKASSEFYPNRRKASGITSWCKDCTKDSIMESQARARLLYKDVNIDAGSKPCLTCGQVKPLTEFYRNSCSRDGKQQHCKACWQRNQKASEQRRPLQNLQVEEKTCSRCGLNQPAANYYKYHKSSDGRQPWCKICVSKYSKQYQAKRAAAAEAATTKPSELQLEN